MSAKLFNDPKPAEKSKPNSTAKRIDDLILDAEIEAQEEINKRIRSEKFKMVMLVLLGVGLFYVLNQGIQNKSIPVPTFLEENPQVAQVPPAPAETPVAPGTAEQAPKPIPFPLEGTAPQAQSLKPRSPESQLENEVLSMLQKNMKGGGSPATRPTPATGQPQPPTSPLEPEWEEEASTDEPEAGSLPSPEVSPAPAPQKRIPVSAPAVKTPSTPVSRKPMTAEQSRYFIQVGAFSVKANADRVVQRLMSSGYSPLVQTRTSRSAMHVVYIGGFADEESPQNMISALQEKGLNPQLNKSDNGSYSIILGKEKSKSNAEAFKQKLTRMGIFTSLKQMKINSRIFVVRVEGFDSGSSARTNQQRIEKMGYAGTIIRKKS